MKRTNPIFAIISILLIGIFMGSCSQKQESSNAPGGFKIHPDFKLELVASEPLIFDPVDMEFDEQGRAFVLEMPGYPLRAEESRVVLLKDKNGDGQYDERQVFADQVGVASSLMPYKEGLLVAAPPDLLWLKDSDGDEMADERQVVMSGFSAGNLQHIFNGLTYGLDNWIYAANGGNNGAPYFIETPEQALDLRGNDFRFDIENKKLERVGESSGGFELAFDNWGNLYETHNLEHVSQLVFEGRYLNDLPSEPVHALTVISDHEENGLSRIYPIGEQETRVNHPEQSGYFSGACGITFYGGNAFPEGFNNNLFVADVVLNLVHLDVLSPDKSAFKTSRMRDKAEFIASSDRAFRPVNLTSGPDGALYLIDMYREVIEHPEWIPDELEVNMDLDAGKKKGRIYRISPKDNWSPAKPVLDSAKPENLVNALADKNQWVRMTAQRIMVESRDYTFDKLLEKLFNSTENPLAKLHALWTLEGLGILSNETIISSFSENAPGLKINALKMAELRLNENPEFIEKIIALTDDPDARVRMQAALTLGTLNDKNYSANKKAISNALSNMLSREGEDIWSALAIASATKKQPADFAKKIINNGQKINENQLEVARTLSKIMGRENNAAQTQQLLSDLSSSQISDQKTKAEIIEALAKGWDSGEARKTSMNEGLMLLLETIEIDQHPSITRACGNLRRSIGLPVSSDTKKRIASALKSVRDVSLPLEDRMALLKLIELEKFENREPVLFQLLDNREPLALQEETLWQLWRADKAHIAKKLLDIWPALGPDARKHAGNILLYKSYNHELLLTALENGKINPGEMNFDLERRRVLLFSEDEKIKKRAEELLSDAGVVTRKEAIEKMRPALQLDGELANGKEQFIMLCSQCHKYGDLGKDVGPILTEINRKSKESLLHDILDPNAAVDTKYLNHQIRTTEGNIHTGMIANETDSEVTLKMLGGQETTINKKNIESLSSLGISMMPEGQEANMSPQDMADLLAFLQQSEF